MRIDERDRICRYSTGLCHLRDSRYVGCARPFVSRGLLFVFWLFRFARTATCIGTDGRTDGPLLSLEPVGRKKLQKMYLASLACQPAPGDRGLCLQKSTNKRSARTAIRHTLPEGVERRTPSRNGLMLENKTCISVCFFIQFIVFALLFLSLLVVTQIRGHILFSFGCRRLFPLPTTARALHFYRKKISALSSLVDSRHAQKKVQVTIEQ